MINWEYEDPQTRKKIPEGAYRLRIADVIIEPKNKDKKHDSIKFIYDVSGQKGKAWSRLTLSYDNPDTTNKIISIMGYSFHIPSRQLQNPNTFTNWVGRYGAGYIINDYGSRVHRFLTPKDQEKLSPWKEVQSDGFEDDELPF